MRREGGPAYGGKSYEAIIRDDWKLMQNDPYGPLELYNLADDPYERRDLAASPPRGPRRDEGRPAQARPAGRIGPLAAARQGKVNDMTRPSIPISV